MRLLTPTEMAEADRRTMAAGTPGPVLMERAGRAVANVTSAFHPLARTVLVLCGPGNNGGDGFVAARILKARGLQVTLAALVPVADLTGDAASAAAAWDGCVLPFDQAASTRADMAIDAVFGAGLSRDVDGVAASTLKTISATMPIVAVDVPSGLNGGTGLVQGFAPTAHHTVTFHRKKPGHVLFPGRALCGRLHLADIGIYPSIVDDLTPATFENGPWLWRKTSKEIDPLAHKYQRGHVGVLSGGALSTGAARLAGEAALRGGAGLVTFLTPSSAGLVNASHATAAMVRSFGEKMPLGQILIDRKIKHVVAGPGMGTGDIEKNLVDVLVAFHGSDRSLVLDADALTIISVGAKGWFEDIPENTVLTPHDGEFQRLFPEVGPGDRLSLARAGAQLSGAVVVLKGA
ncbi:MAG: NAD(P)H-hydrate epimerase, partial [Pseudomonadota bacterium]